MLENTLHPIIETIKLTGYPIDVTFLEDSVIVSVFNTTSLNKANCKAKVIISATPLQVQLLMM